MNACVISGLRKSLPGRSVSTMELIGLFTLAITLVSATPGFAFSNPNSNLAIAQDDESTDDWIKFAPTGALASFEMPKKPRYVERNFSPIQNKPPIKVRMHLATVAEGNLTYVFSYHDLHQTPKDRKTVAAALDGAVTGSVVNVLGQLVDPKEIGTQTNPQLISQDGHEGRQFVCRFFQNEKRFIVTGRVFLVDKRLYQLSSIMAEDVYDAKIAVRFLGSLQIIDPNSDLPPRPRVAKTN